MWKEIESFLAPYRSQIIFVACSGGVDSMSLLHYLHSKNYTVHALHVNYHKRGKESDADQQLLVDYCLEHIIPLTIRDFSKKSKGNFQEQARQFRYQFFEEFAQKFGGVIALAHHADDQVETFCMNLMRKSGVMGMASMPRIRGKYIRPFLQLPKDEIANFAAANNIPWREDASNKEANYLRNKWRLEFIPLMEKQNPALRSEILTLVETFQTTQRELEISIQPLSNEIRETAQISISTLKNFSSEERFELWRQLDQESNLFHRFEELLSYSHGKHMEGTGLLQRIFVHHDALHFDYQHTPNIPELVQTLVETLPSIYSKNEIYLNPTKLVGELKIRPWQEGDSISPIGMKGKQKVSKIIKDAGIPLKDRPFIYVVHDQATIHWVVGLKIGQIALANPRDTSIIHLRLK